MSGLATLLGQLPLPTDEVDIPDSLTSGDWLRAGAIVIASLAVAAATGRILRGVLQRAIGDGFAAIIVARIVAYVLFVIGLVYALNSLGIRVGPLLGALGLSGLVLALALQSVAENFVGGVILQTRRPFTLGDTVELGDHTGVVVDIDSRTTVLRGLDGTHIRLPNGNVLAAPIVNLTREELRRSELEVGVAYDSDLQSASRVLAEAVGRVPRIASDPEPWVMLREFGDSSIVFTIYFWHHSDVPAALAARHDLVIAVHQALAAAGIAIAFPQLVVWPGHDADDDPYPGPPGRVHTERRTIAAPRIATDPHEERRRWRSPFRRRR